MQQISQQLAIHKEQILHIISQHGATWPRLFGSVARGEEHAHSDIDILITLNPDRTLLDIIAIKQDLEDLLNCSVDVVTEAALSPYIREQILQEAVPFMRDDTVYLQHILDSIATIEKYVAVGHQQFMTESHWQDATIRQLEVIGEATKQLSDDLRTQYSEVPWRKIAGLRDVLIHNYLGVDLNTVWNITQTNIPVLREQIEAIMTDLK